MDMVSPTTLIGMFGLPSGGEWIILLVLGLLIFGRRLPEVGRSIGKSIVEFKRGIKDINDDVEEESSKPGRISSRSNDQSLPESDDAAGATVEAESREKVGQSTDVDQS